MSEINIDEIVSRVLSIIPKDDSISEKEIQICIETICMLWKVEPPISEINKKKIYRRVMERTQCTLLKPCRMIKSESKEWFRKKLPNLEMYYWKRYKEYLSIDKGFSMDVVNKMEDVLVDLTDLAGDPSEQSLNKRGLIIGDVQSGKTANLIGLINMSIDSGYELIIILAGTIESLRKQTQERVDEGIVGRGCSSAVDTNKSEHKGVYKYCDQETFESRAPLSFTTINNDFSVDIARRWNMSIKQAKVPIVFVMKKNVSILHKLNKWLSNLNKTSETGRINNSILVIDDECDYASIDTNREDCDPTKTNEEITSLLSKFERTSYVGFTATPYANIFINPETTDEMETSTLFPKDYIYCLESPSNYIGARDIFGEYGDKSYMIKTIYDNVSDILPLKHKKNNSFVEVPVSLKIAINEFFIGNAIRDIDGSIKSHRSMLINMSVLKNIHKRIAEKVEDYVNGLRRSINYYAMLSESDWKNERNIMDLYHTFNNEKKYYTDEFNNITWSDILQSLPHSCATIKVVVINQESKDSIDFKANENDGLRVIAIGGMSLSRGLTLEGLMVSYFYRNTSTYDTLMQMGRWFGYREGYEKLCRIWMTEDVQEYFIKINEATEELRDEIMKYRKSELTPLDFGLRVRADSNLLITAKNKMRTAQEGIVECTLSSKILETPYMVKNKKYNADNLNAVFLLMSSLNNSNYRIEQADPGMGTAVGYKNVSVQFILEFLQSVYVTPANIEFQKEAIIDFINEYSTSKLSKWDIAFIQGGSENIFKINEEIQISKVKRSFDIKNNKFIRINGVKRRVGSPSDCNFGLSKEKRDKLLEEKRIITGRADVKLSQKDCINITDRNPILMIYFIELTCGDEDYHITSVKNDFKRDPLVCFSLGIPDIGYKSKKIKYVKNKIQQGIEQLKFDLYDEEGSEEIE